MGEAISDSSERKNIILPKTFVHIHTALAEVAFIMNQGLIPYVVVEGLDKQGNNVTIAGKVVKVKKEWSEGISTIIIEPDINENGKEITIGGKFALIEDIRMEKLILDEHHPK
jgi:hypothetical protein